MTLKIPDYYLENGRLRHYQEEAIQAWFRNNGRGIFHMATGSGKTVTALAAMIQLSDFIIRKGGKLGIIILVPFQHLAEQWAKESQNFGFRIVRCFENKKNWLKQAQISLLEIHSHQINRVVFIVVNQTFIGNAFQAFLYHFNFNLLFVADEMHNLGSSKIKTLLPQKAHFRLGLSATPERYFDEEGTKTLQTYFDKTVVHFGLKEAIESQYLCPYHYYPVLVALSEEEMSEYLQISRQIAKLTFSEEDEHSKAKKERFLFKRARLVNQAENKVEALLKTLAAQRESLFNLIYCGSGGEEKELKHIELVLKAVGTKLGMRVAKFTAEETISERTILLKGFSQGKIQALVAINCLDEGVDIPRTETAYILASSSNPRQFIQRRGRVLRKSKGKALAKIFDFIVIPPMEKISTLDDKTFNVERKLVQKEITRVNEFASIAINSGEALSRLRNIKKQYNLLDI